MKSEQKQQLHQSEPTGELMYVHSSWSDVPDELCIVLGSRIERVMLGGLSPVGYVVMTKTHVFPMSRFDRLGRVL